jgi:hypothetical protein
MSACAVCGSIGTVESLFDPDTGRVIGWQCGICSTVRIFVEASR